MSITQTVTITIKNLVSLEHVCSCQSTLATYNDITIK